LTTAAPVAQDVRELSASPPLEKKEALIILVRI
jgi:hypothetical protein